MNKFWIVYLKTCNGNIDNEIRAVLFETPATMSEVLCNYTDNNKLVLNIIKIDA